MEKVYPSIEDLCKSTRGIRCPQCDTVFNSESHLNLHLAKTHGKPEFLQPNKTNNKIYHCPISTCSYHSAAHFKQLKCLKQHYLKVHMEKTFNCPTCHKTFSTPVFRDRHAEYCASSFQCLDCDSNYSCYETLKTHSRRKKHKILDKTSYKVGQAALKSPRSETSFKSVVKPLPVKIAKSTGMFVVMNTSDRASQTETDEENVVRATHETQTLGMKLMQMTVETQTIGDYYSKKSEIVNPKCSKTQTNILAPAKTVSCNTSFDFHGLDLELGNEVRRSSSSTQTGFLGCDEDLAYSSSTSTHDSIHTDTSDLLNDTLEYLNNCNMETQTEFMLNDELLKYCDYYSNMHTQTCEDLLLGEIGLNDIQTQTVFDDVLKSVESQTIMSQSRKLPYSCKDMSHMETQTDLEFKKIFEGINA